MASGVWSWEADLRVSGRFKVHFVTLSFLVRASSLCFARVKKMGGRNYRLLVSATSG